MNMLIFTNSLGMEQMEDNISFMKEANERVSHWHGMQLGRISATQCNFRYGS